LPIPLDDVGELPLVSAEFALASWGLAVVSAEFAVASWELALVSAEPPLVS
jgi:hypothetical protein